MKVEKNPGLSCMSDSLSIETSPLPLSSVRQRSATSNERSPKNPVAPCCSNWMIFRMIAPTDAGEIRPYSLSISSRPSLDRYCITLLKSRRSSRGHRRSSQYLKTSATTPSCVSFSPSILEKRIGPNSATVARSRTPGSSDRLRNSTGLAPGKKGSPMALCLSKIFPLSSAVAAIPLRSPLISISMLGTPLWLSCSARICSVFVLPVPVAPAIRPCRLSVRKGIRIKCSCITVLSSMAPPIITVSPLKRYASFISREKFSAGFIVGSSFLFEVDILTH